MKKVLLVLLVVVAGFAVFVASRPAKYHVERTATMSAPPSVVYAQLVDFHRWDAWSPWEKIDPAMKKTFEGAESGAGASYRWVGNDQVGEGRMTITDAVPGERVAIDLEFIKPWASKNVTVFDLAAADGGTKIVWSMDGDNDFMAKAFSIFMNMDQMIGTDFEKGLTSLDSVATAAAAAGADSAAAGAMGAVGGS